MMHACSAAGRVFPHVAVIAAVLLGLCTAARSLPADLPAASLAVPAPEHYRLAPAAQLSAPGPLRPIAGAAARYSALALAVRKAPPHPEGAPPGHTGGFGEPTCHSCHFDAPLNDEEGAMSLIGLPDDVEPARSYTIEIRLVRPDMQRAGFQLTARFEDGGQAGTFELLDDRVQIVSADSSEIHYLTHTAAGTTVTEPGATSWRVRWCSPDQLPGRVVFHAAANAANDDRSEFGDAIYVLERD